MTDFELIVKEFCIPIENELVCDELCGWDVDEEDESWCSRNCGKTNCGQYPEMNCYKEWVKMKRSDGEMNLLEHYIKEIHSVTDITSEVIERCGYEPSEPLLEVDLTYDCYGVVTRNKRIFRESDFEIAKKQGYFMQ